jgi:hypothetical protein
LVAVLVAMGVIGLIAALASGASEFPAGLQRAIDRTAGARMVQVVVGKNSEEFEAPDRVRFVDASTGTWVQIGRTSYVEDLNDPAWFVSCAGPAYKSLPSCRHSS